MRRKPTPQEKKTLSYAKDARNTIAESRNIANKAISKRKAKANRAYRHALSVKLEQGLKTSEEIDDFVAREGRKSFKKIPDAPLAVYVSARLNVRLEQGMCNDANESELLDTISKKLKRKNNVLKGSLQVKNKK